MGFETVDEILHTQNSNTDLCRCEKHAAKCSRRFTGKPVDFNIVDAVIVAMVIAGSACTDFSSFGNRQMSAGPTVIYLLILLRMILDWKPDILLHENVISFPQRLLEEVLDSLYSIESHILHPQQGGFPIDRRRRYCICRFRLKLTSLDDITLISDVFRTLF